LKQLTRALGYIHHGIRDVIHEGASGAREPGWEMLLHRDIAPKNIFIRRSGERVRFLLGDFGCAMEFHNQAIWRVKTPAWGPPEAPRYVEQSDIWSLGLVISSMAVLEGPAKRYGALSNMHDMFGNIEREFSPQLADAIERALHPDYRKRPTAVTFGPYLRESQRIAYYTDHDFPDQWDEDGDDPLSLWY
jgi:serine/threonine protein kinase